MVWGAGNPHRIAVGFQVLCPTGDGLVRQVFVAFVRARLWLSC